MRRVRPDCRHYLGDRPCGPHKRTGVTCDRCGLHELSGRRVLLVKLDAMGDVLRTTCILEPLARALASEAGGAAPHLTWLTRPESLPLLRGNPYVQRAVPYGHEGLLHALGEPFDLVICLDAARDAARLASLALAASAAAGRKPRAAGFLLQGAAVAPADERAHAWWQMGLWDDLKAANTRTYQHLMMECLGLSGPPGDYVLRLEPGELAEGRLALETAGLASGEPFLALNAGGGGRWEFKRWTAPHIVRFVHLARERLGLRTALFGGEAEVPFIRELLGACPAGTFFPGVHPVRRFAAMLAAASALVTGDTLAMHLALATGCPSAILFGPTSKAEIETYGRGVKLAPEMDCLCCYLPRCERQPYCQELLEPERVLDAVKAVMESQR